MYLNKIMITKTFPKVPGIDLCKSKGKNVMFEAGINKVQRCSEMWLGFDGAYLTFLNDIDRYCSRSDTTRWPDQIFMLH